ncbi:hypothetical protein [Lewinella sp. JB7]|uniref:hypothetical protein n=1 Tax=Lewinella sp. JB7 TaxID=2962887 RepID=UPI0020C973AE|nr:hypothetical protein [Lewinella sp. JB7]MCP9234587.1 hypothetical protein [Lewinella sp. JB7]
MRFYAISIDQIVIRFYLMMAFVLIGEFSGLHFITAIAFPIFLSAILGIRYEPISKTQPTTKVIDLPRPTVTTDKVA